MNNFPSFLDNAGGGMANNNLRQAPSPGQAPNQMNGMSNGMFGGVGGLHQAGQPSDMNVLWSMVQHLSEQLAEERRQSAALIRNVQQLEERVVHDGQPPTLAQANGDRHANRTGEIASLQSQLSAANRQNVSLESDNAALASLVHQHEQALELILEKIRPFAYTHAQALNAQKAHYTALLEQERQQNLELRLEHQEWQAGMGRVAEYARLAFRHANDRGLPCVRRIAALKNERRLLRRLAGWEEAVDSSDEEDEEELRKEEGLVQL